MEAGYRVALGSFRAFKLGTEEAADAHVSHSHGSTSIISIAIIMYSML